MPLAERWSVAQFLGPGVSAAESSASEMTFDQSMTREICEFYRFVFFSFLFCQRNFSILAF